MAVCSQIHTKPINTLCGRNVGLLNVKLAVHIVTTGLYSVTVLLQCSCCTLRREAVTSPQAPDRSGLLRQLMPVLMCPTLNQLYSTFSPLAELLIKQYNTFQRQAVKPEFLKFCTKKVPVLEHA